MKNRQINKGMFLVLFISNFLMFLAINTLSILPAYLEEQGSSRTFIALFTTMPNIMLVLFVIIQLRYKINLPRKGGIRLGYLIFIVSMGGMYLFQGNLLLMFLFFLLTGITYALGFTLLFSLFYDITPQEIRGSRAALYGISGLLAGGLGAAIGQASFLNLPISFLFLWAGIFAFMGFMCSFFLKEQSSSEYSKEQYSLTQLIKTPRIWGLIFLALLMGGALSTYKTFLPLISKSRLGIVEITTFFYFFTIIGVLYRLIFSRFIDKVRRRNLFFFSFGAIFISILYLQFFEHFFELGIIGALFGLGHSLLFPTLSVFFVELGGRNKTVFNNIFLALFTTGIALLPPLLGLFGDFFGLLVIPFILNGLVLSGLAVSYFITKGDK